MIVKLKKKKSAYRDLTLDQPYVVMGIEGDDLRILNDSGRPYLYPRNLFSVINSTEPNDWITEFGQDRERYSYPPALSKPGFFEDFFEEKSNAVATFWHVVNQRLPTTSETVGLTDRATGKKKPHVLKSAAELDKEIYAAAGLALRWAQLFESEIVTVVLVYGVSRGKFEVRSEAEEFIRKAEKRPLTQLLHETLQRVKFEPDVSGTFEEAISARNFLVHSFFWNRSEAFADVRHQSQLLEELRELTQLFFSAHKFAEIVRDMYIKQFDNAELADQVNQLDPLLRKSK
jgi:hypothetical protein